jgi:Fur family transcriptional regulator, ferric uptake regulator
LLQTTRNNGPIDAPPSAYAGRVDLETALRDGGCRLTRPRQVVWDVLNSTEHHLNANEIAERVRLVDRGINLSSVYRTLALFADLDLVRETHLDQDASTWEIAHADQVIHLRCATCGDVRHYDAAVIETLRAQLRTRAGFRASSIDVRVSGTCEACSADV